MRSYTIDFDAPNSTGKPMAAAGSEAPVTLPEVPQSHASPDDRAVPGEAAVAPSGPTPTPTPKPAPAPNNQAAAPPAPAASAPQAPPMEVSAPARGNFVVQLGSFGSKENAERLVRDMKAKGFATFIAPITTNGRELYRVRVGPAKDRPSAEALAAELKRAGQSGSIVPIS
jgi:DedD protein